MKLTCPTCNTSYRIADEKIPPSGARANCPNCGQVILIPPRGSSPGASVPLARSSGADFGQTIAYDYSEVDQSGSEVSALLEEVSGTDPFIRGENEALFRDVQTGEEFLLTAPRVTVGRTGNDINLNDPEVSRRHCHVRVFGDRFVIEDLGSTNGTFYQGKRVMTVKLGTGDRFTVGNTTLETVIRGKIDGLE
ncbi:MAG: FHA domain-containing protein [bacterium]|nr:FHA domain-containing protein [bacterium]